MKVLQIVGLLLLGISLASAETTGGYSFTVDGETVYPQSVPIEDEDPQKGDVVVIGDLALCLDEPGKYDFKIHAGRVIRILPNGGEVMVACSVTDESEGDATFLDSTGKLRAPTKKSNPLEGMTDEELRSLRGVRLNVWPDGIEKQLARLNLEQVCLEVCREDPFYREQKVSLSALPDEVRALLLSGRTTAMWDLSRLQQMKKLRFLDMQNMTLEEFDAGALRDLPLEYFSAPHTSRAKDVNALASLTRLKWLSAKYCSYLGDARWMAHLTELHDLYIDGTLPPETGGIVPLDLAALSGLPHLASIHADGSPVKSLPRGHRPSLRSVSLLLSRPPEGDLKAMIAANPQAIVTHEMNAALSARLVGADRMVLKTGPMGSLRKERQAFETTDQAEVEQFIRHLEVNDKESGGYCRCAGDPLVEFYRGDQFLAEVGMHHGIFLRWGGWPGDGTLMEPSSNYLVEWLASHGFPGPKEEVLRNRREQAAYVRRNQRYHALLPVELYAALSQAQMPKDAEKAWSRLVPNVRQRAVLFLRLYGCDDGTWSSLRNWDEVLQGTWLPSLPAITLRSVINAAPERTEECQGAARWLFGEGHVTEWKGEPETVQRLARFALTHPRKGNRWRTLESLRDLGTPFALEVLREVMQHGTTPRKLSTDEETEAGGYSEFRAGTIWLPEGTADSVVAALCLATLKDEISAEDIRSIKSSLGEEARRAWDESQAEYREMTSQTIE